MSIMRLTTAMLAFAMATLPLSAQEQTKDATPSEWKTSLSVRANLLRWATLTPDLGVELSLNRNIGIAVEGAWTTWTWGHSRHRYALREIAPELRWYIGSGKRAYIGAMYKAGAFNYCLSDNGKEGNINGGGLTGGYKMRLDKNLDLDLTVGVGYIHATYDKYIMTEGTRIFQGHEKKNMIMPINLGVTLAWTLF